tara:strand:- start:891 stop:1118 length:228 start_codon:yes stop_codon:yes gene_type:complete
MYLLNQKQIVDPISARTGPEIADVLWSPSFKFKMNPPPGERCSVPPSRRSLVWSRGDTCVGVWHGKGQCVERVVL